MLESHYHCGGPFPSVPLNRLKLKENYLQEILKKLQAFDDWPLTNEGCEEPPEISMCVVVGTVYQWYTLHIQTGKWWLHFPGKEHTFQESPQNHQICASVPESLQVQRADPWGSGSEVIETHGIAWMGCVDLRKKKIVELRRWIWSEFYHQANGWRFLVPKIPFPQKRRKPQDLKIWRIRVDTPKNEECMIAWPADSEQIARPTCQ